MRLIDADKLIENLGISYECSACKLQNGIYCKGVFANACEEIIKAPTVDIRKNTKARLIVKAEGLTHYYICDQCGASIDPEDTFCRKCGAEIGG